MTKHLAQQLMEQTIIETVRSHPYASFVEVIDACGPEAKGTLAWEATGAPNVFLWTSMSEMFIAAFNAVKPRLSFHPASSLMYLADGRVPRMPLATNAGVKRGYKKPHWAPVTMTLIP